MSDLTVKRLDLKFAADSSPFRKGAMDVSNSLDRIGRDAKQNQAKFKQMGDGVSQSILTIERQQEGLRVKELNLTPIEKYKKEINNLRSLLREGAIDQRTFSRAAKKLDSELGTDGWKGWAVSIAKATAALGALSAAAAGAALTKLATDGMHSVVTTTRLADRLGVTTEALIGLQHAASQSLGADQVETFTDALSDMQEKIGDITTEQGGATDIVKILGLDAATLASQDAVTNFKAIADAISKVKSKAEKLHIADTLFGGSGQRLLPLLEQGSAGIEQFAAEAEKLGLTFSRVDGAKVELAQAAIGRVGAQIQGVGQELAIGLSPYIEAAANYFQQLGVTGGKVSDYLIYAMETVGTGVGVLLDVLHTVQLAWVGIKAAAASMVSGVISVIADMADSLESFLNSIPGIEVEFGNTLRAMADDAAEFADTEWTDFQSALAAPPPSEGIQQFFNEVKQGAADAAQAIADAHKPVDKVEKSLLGVTLKVEEMRDRLKAELANFGQDSNQIEIFKLQGMGATVEQLKELKKLADDLKGKSIIEANMTPLEKYRKELKELQDLMDSGSIDLTTFERAKKKLDEQSGLNQKQDSAPIELKFASAVKLGSDEARQAVLRHQGLGKDPNVGVEKNTAIVATESKKQTEYLRKMAMYSGEMDEVIEFP